MVKLSYGYYHYRVHDDGTIEYNSSSGRSIGWKSSGLASIELTRRYAELHKDRNCILFLKAYEAARFKHPVDVF